jgi:ribosomal protein L37AE/L43A
MVERKCPTCGRKSYSADGQGTWECPYGDCGAEIPPPEGQSKSSEIGGEVNG